MKRHLLVALALCCAACDKSEGVPALADASIDAASTPSMRAGLPEGAVGTEMLRVTLGEPIAKEALVTLFGDVLGGGAMAPHAVPGGLVLTRAVDPADGDGVVRFRYQLPGKDGQLRDFCSIPVSRAVAQRFVDLTLAAHARMEKYLSQPDATPDEAMMLELRAHSDADGELTLRVSGVGTKLTLTHVVRGRHQLIGERHHGEPAAVGDEWTSIAVSVGFNVRQDQLNFFVDKAYGKGQAKGQKFDHFVLGAPHDWMNVTVTPWMGQVAAVKVSFEVVLPDGSRLPFAAAPASDDMGEQFIQDVNGAMNAMEQAEAAAPGSSARFEIPYFYDDPLGGVVQVRVDGQGGTFLIFYDLETVRTPNGEDPPPLVPAKTGTDPTSGDYGQGRLAVSFEAASAISEGKRLDSPLVGTIRADVFRSSDVEITGPVAGAKALASIHVDAADLRDGKRSIPVITGELPAVPVKVLGFMDVDANAAENDPGPDAGDPVTVPFMEFQVLDGLTSEITVSFDLVY